ncbi:P-loop containing nucleoside triphosphate hydrolase protein [Mycena floridula]|nr:P-loop containing nucleoside triphosphate hydrolase protein [Mycena floridula]
MSHQRLEKLSQAGTIAATILRDIADVTSASYLQAVASLAVSIFDTVENVKTNKEKCAIMTERVYQLVCAIINCSTDSQSSISATLLHSISTLTVTLQKVLSFMRNQVGGSFVKRITRHLENAALLEDCMSSLGHAITIFKVQTDIMTAAMMTEMQANATRRHRELTAFINASDVSSLTRLSSSSTISILLPASPKIFHGRTSQLDQMVTQLCASSSARLAILGPGGVGKSSLALALLYHSEIIAKYGSRRYWIACDSCNSAGDVMAVLAATFGVEDHGDPVNAILRRLEDAQDPSLLVLDNFETPWEGPESRVKVEDLLSRLTELDQLRLIITMRGAERPGQVKWTRPFMRPLEPLSYDAARETFLEISDVSESDPHLDELLALTDNLPLAVALMAGVAESETCDVVLKRWKSENTLLLSDGFDKRSNLEKSIGLSLHCPRMLALPHARDLLSILAFLPDGVSDSELQEIALPSIQIGPCRTTLCRTSLAYINHDGRLRVLAPIREYVLSTLPPLPTHLNSLRRYIFGLINLLDGYQRTPGIARKLISSIGNISFTIQQILEQNDTEVKDAVMAVIKLSRLYSISKLGSFDLLKSLSGPVETLKDDSIHGKYLLVLASQPDCKSREAAGLQAIEALGKTEDRPGLGER